MTTRRTTLAADADDLATLEAEARRRQISLARLLREMVEREVEQLRGDCRPRVGVASSGTGAASVAARDEHAPARRSARS